MVFHLITCIQMDQTMEINCSLISHICFSKHVLPTVLSHFCLYTNELYQYKKFPFSCNKTSQQRYQSGPGTHIHQLTKKP